MVNEKNVVRLYRAMDERDSRTLISRETDKLSIHSMNREMISHELCSKTKRGVLFSFTTSLGVAKEYGEHYEKKKICYVDISVDKPARSVIEILPVFDRALWLNRMALDDILLEEKILVNPATRRNHTIVGLTNFSQRTACGWAASLKEVMLQVDGLELKELSDMSGNISTEETETILLDCYIKKVPYSNIRELRLLIEDTFANIDLKRTKLLDLVHGDSWYKAS